MLTCKKCHCHLAERPAQQSFCELEETLLAGNTRINARRKAMQHGPLCDVCLANWQANHSTDSRSPAIRALDEACSKLEESMLEG